MQYLIGFGCGVMATMFMFVLVRVFVCIVSPFE